MRWIIEGADAETGEEQTVTIEATDRHRAEFQARQMGLLVSTIRPAPQPIASDAPRVPWTTTATDNNQEMTLSSLATVAPAVPSSSLAGSSIGPVKLQVPAPESSEPAPVQGTSVDYATPRGIARPGASLFDELPPDYRSLRIAATVLLGLAIASYSIGVVALIERIFTSPWRLSDLSIAMIARLLEYLWVSMTPLIVGGVLHGLSAGCAALRDVARNSFLVSRQA